MQFEVPLSLHRVLAPVRVAPAIRGQCAGIDANLLGNENNHRCRGHFTRKQRPTEMPQETELDGKAEPVVRGPLGLD